MSYVITYNRINLTTKYGYKTSKRNVQIIIQLYILFLLQNVFKKIKFETLIEKQQVKG